LEDFVEKGKTASLAVAFAGLLWAAKLHKGLAARFGRRQSALEIFFDGEFEMSGDFGV
jgi:hypothetical protein